MGYRGHGGDTTIHIVEKSNKKPQAMDETTSSGKGHLKLDYPLNKNYLKGKAGDAANFTLAATAYNMAKLLAQVYCAKFLSQQIRAFICQFGFNRNNQPESVA